MEYCNSCLKLLSQFSDNDQLKQQQIANNQILQLQEQEFGHVQKSVTQLSFDPPSIPEMMDDDSGWGADDETYSNAVSYIA